MLQHYGASRVNLGFSVAESRLPAKSTTPSWLRPAVKYFVEQWKNRILAVEHQVSKRTIRLDPQIHEGPEWKVDDGMLELG